MKSMEERVEEVMHDETKFKRLFNFAWIVAYSMLILGFFIILWVILQGR